MSFNSSGISTIVNATYQIFDYTAYGTGTVIDNATALDAEVARVVFSDQTAYSNYFVVLGNIGSGTANGNTLTEYGLAVANTGDISTTENYYSIIKTGDFEILINSTIVFSGLI